MINIKRIVRIYWPILLLIFLEGLLVGVNVTPNTHLVGWDNMFPEFDFPTNIKRTLFATWQEYRGLGYQDGMSHAANLIHYLLLWIMSTVIPQQILRYAFVFGTHLLGGIGMYILILNLKIQNSKPNITKAIALFGALFYQYCFATVQMFYLPFELFLVHFASLPWIFLTLSRFLRSGKKSDAVWFGLVMLLATPQAHVPTVFLVTGIAVALYLLWELIASKGALFKRMAVIVAIAFCMNAFWGLPFAYSTLTRSDEITNSKNNQIGTEDIFEKNHAFGGFLDTAEMKSFALTYIYYDYKTLANDSMMRPWVSHTDSPFTEGCLLSLFALAVMGSIIACIRRDKSIMPYTLLFLFAFLVIGNDIPILSSFSWLARTYVPYVSDIFRFVFTKFFFLYAFSFALCISYGLSVLAQWGMKKRPIIALLPIVGASIILFITTIPSFQGNFLYKNLQVEIPKEYFQVFSFFKEQPSDERILVLPMPWYWAWTQYRWGVIGSGFTWFGIRHPLIDRAFDPWSRFNENVYWEFSQAIYEKNSERFRELLTKYDIRWVMVDENIMHPTNDKALYLSQIETLLRENPSIQKEKQFGKITLFSFPKQSNSFIQIQSDLPNIGPQSQWNDRDQAYSDNGSYVTSNALPFTGYYPFRSLFTGHEQNEKEFTVSVANKTITFSNTVPSLLGKLTNSPIASQDGQLALSFQTDTLSATIPITQSNTVYDSDKTTDLLQPIRSCDASRIGPTTSSWLGYKKIESSRASACIDIGISDLSQRYGYLVTVSSRHISGRRLFISITNEETKRTFLENYVTDKGISNEFIDSFFIIPPMDGYGQGYRITLDNLSVSNDKTINDIASIRIYTIPYDEMVSLKIDNAQLTMQNKEQNTISITDVEHPNPAYYKISIAGVEGITGVKENTLILSQSFDEGWKAYDVSKCQSVKGIKAMQIICETFPFLFGKEIKEHVLVNNWSNGWTLKSDQSDSPRGEAGQFTNQINENTTIVVFFLPQLLEWIGFLVLPLPFFFLLARPKS